MNTISNNTQFISEYMTNAIIQGKNSPSDICSEAQREIEELEDKIKAIESLRGRQNNLKAVIRQLGGAEPLKRAKKAPMISDSVFSVDDLDPYMKNLCAKICDFIENSPDPVGPSEIIYAVGSIEENKASYTAIKWLLEQGILERTDEGVNRYLSEGINWENRPTQDADVEA